MDHRVLTRVDTDFHPLLFEAAGRSTGSELVTWASDGLTVRALRGRKMSSLQRLFDEFSAALQFPLYFGENRDAFDECIAELETLSAGKGFVLVVTNPEIVLADEGPSAMRWLVHSLAAATAEWAQPVELGEWWDRPAVPFHVVLAVESAHVQETVLRWGGAGASPMRFDA